MMLGKRTLYVITGASRGYGRTLAVVVAEAAGASSTFLLLARDESGLNETRDLMLEANAKIRVETCSIDLESADSPELSRCLSSVAISSSSTTYEVGVLVHNAGSIGRPSLRASEFASRPEVLAYFGLNVVSPVVLTSTYLSVLRESAQRHVIVNISSIAALQPISSLSLYSTGKAARDMFFRTLAVEEPSLRVLNWAPGPMATAVLKEVVNHSYDSEMRNTFSNPEFLVDMKVSAKQALALLEKDEFESGAHIDIYDVWKPTEVA